MEEAMKNSEGISSMVVEVTEEIMSGSTVINRIPATASSRKHNHNKASRNNAVKRRGSFGSKQSRGSSDDSYDRSASSSSSSHQRGGRSSSHVARPSPKRLCQPMDLEEEFDRLDPKQEDHARRIFQRRKALQKGKNTPGYHNYVAQVPKHQRIARSMKTPSTPDPTIKISTKRWQGLVKAWRIALHDYDPPELVSSRIHQAAKDFVASEGQDGGRNSSDCAANDATGGAANDSGAVASGVRAAELHKAAAMGLLVDDVEESGGIGDDDPASPAGRFIVGVDGDDNEDDFLLDESSPISVLTDSSARRRCSPRSFGIATFAEPQTPVPASRIVSATRPSRWADDDSSDDDDLL